MIRKSSTTSPGRTDPLWAQLEALTEGTLTDDSRLLLEDRLRADLDARQFAVAYLDQHAQLQWQVRGMAVEERADTLKKMFEDAQASKRPRRPGFLGLVGQRDGEDGRGSILAFMKPMMAVAALILVALLIQMAMSEAEPGSDEVFADPLAVAQLTRVAGAEFKNRPLQEGDWIRPGDFELAVGMAEITFKNGASVVLEGPVRFQLREDGRPYLRSGRLSAYVPPAAEGFTIQTDLAKVVDHGTAFGVYVQPGSKRTEVHVFEGLVSLDFKDVNRPDASSTIYLQANEARSLHVAKGIDPNADIASGETIAVELERTNVTPSSFIGRVELTQLIDESKLGDVPARVTASILKRLRSPDLLALYTFDNGKNKPDELLSRVPMGRENLNGELGAGERKPRWMNVGPTPGQQSLAFFGGELVELPYTSSMNPQAFTVEAWVQVGDIAGEFRTVVSSRASKPLAGGKHATSGYTLYIKPDGVWSFWTGDGFTWDMVDGPQAVPGQWTHVAMSFEPTDDTKPNSVLTGTKRLFINGELVAEQANRGYKPMRTFGHALRIGAGANEDKAGNYFYSGLMSELSLYNRAIDANRILNHYHAGRP